MTLPGTSGSVRGRLRRFYWRHLRRYRYETCRPRDGGCGRPVGPGGPVRQPTFDGASRELGPISAWDADDELWLAVIGQYGGNLCTDCFARRCYDAGAYITWRVERNP